MSRRSQPTARQVRLGMELRKLRERAGVTAREASRLVGVDPARMAHWESGRVAVGEEGVRRLTAQYRLTDQGLIDALAAVAEGASRGWWESYRGVLPQGFLDLAELEHHATYMRTVEVTQIPGLLQTEDHARAVFGNGLTSELPQQELDARVAHRMERRSVFQRERPTPFQAVIHEAALRIRVAGRVVARAQLKSLAEVSEDDHIELRVVPFDLDGFATAGYAMLYLGGTVPELDTVQLDSVHSGVHLDEEAQLRKHRGFYDGVRARSLGPDESRACIHKVLLDM